jgi:hypothetical protein
MRTKNKVKALKLRSLKDCEVVFFLYLAALLTATILSRDKARDVLFNGVKNFAVCGLIKIYQVRITIHQS